MVEFTRRQFIKIGGGGLVGSWVGSQFGGFTQVAEAAPSPVARSIPLTVPKFVTPLLIPPVMPKAGTDQAQGRQERRLLRDLREAVPSRSCRLVCLPPRSGGTVRCAAASKRGLLLHNAPSLTIEAQADAGAREVDQRLVDANGDYLPHLLPVDPTLHWANPPGGMMGRDTRPTFAETPGPLYRPGADASPTCTAPSASATRATATPRPGTCRPPATPGRLRDEGHLVRLLRRQGGRRLRCDLGSGLRHVPVSEPRTGRPPSGITTTRWA